MSTVVTFELSELLGFVFPAGLQHPLSTGRLYAFGLHGPLVNGELRSGRKGSHVVARWELDAMCDEFEREDLLRVYVDASLSRREQEEIIAQADVKNRNGKGLMPQLTKDQVRELLEPLENDGTINFDEAQRTILRFRDDRLQRLKITYPDVKKPQKIVIKQPEKKKKFALSPSVAPAEMFKKNAGLTNHGIASATNRLLSIRAFDICADVRAGNSPELTANVRLLRTEDPTRYKAGAFSTVTRTFRDKKSLTETRLKMRAITQS